MSISDALWEANELLKMVYNNPVEAILLALFILIIGVTVYEQLP